MSKANPTAGAEDSSLNLTMRTRTPHPIAHAFTRMRGPGLGPAERWSTTLGFVDVTLRFLTAVMYCELRGLGLSPVGHAAELLEKKIHDPKYGDWSRAAFALGNQLRGCDCLFPEIAQAFGDNAERSELALAFKAIIEERNEGAHQEIPFPGDVLAPEILGRFQPRILAICAGLRPFRTAPLLALLDNQQAENGYLVSALRLVGETVSAVPQFTSSEPLGVVRWGPFLLGADGRALCLRPFVVLDRDGLNHDYAVRVLARWGNDAGAWLYSRPEQREVGPSATGWDVPTGATARTSLLQREPSGFRKPQGIPASALPHFDADGPESSFPIPGFQNPQRIGHGGTSQVWKSRRIVQGRPPEPTVAIKILHPDLIRYPTLVSRMAREARVLRELNHPNIVRVESFGVDPVPHIVMEFVEGTDLEAHVQSFGKMRADAAGQAVTKLLDALESAHKLGIVHRDVKPRNVILSPVGEPRLIDFGIALDRSDGGNTTYRDEVGTVNYMAPEQRFLGREVDARADVYSVGKLLQFLVTGDVNSSLDDVLPGMLSIIRRATQPDRQDRFASARGMAEALRERMEARWGGAPLMAGDRLARSFSLGPLAGLDGDVFAFHATEDVTNRALVALVACAGVGRGRPRLADALSRLSESTRTALRFPRALNDDHGILALVCEGADPGAVLESVLNDRPVGAASTEVPLPPGFAPYLAGIYRLHAEWTRRGAVEAIEIVQGAELVRRALAVLCAQVGAVTGVRPSVDDWRELTNGTFGGAASTLDGLLGAAQGGSHFAFDVTPWRKDILSLKWLAQQRNEIAHGRGPDSPTVRVVDRYIPGLQAILNLGVALRAQIPADAGLTPLVVEREGSWFVLDLTGRKGCYLSLDGDRRSIEFDESARRWVADREEIAASSRDEAAEREAVLGMLAARKAERVLAAMSGVAVVVVSPGAGTFRTPTLENPAPLDLAAVRADGRLLATLLIHVGAGYESVGDLPTDVKQRLVQGNRATPAPFAGATDGTRFLWFAAASDGSLVALPISFTPPWLEHS